MTHPLWAWIQMSGMKLHWWLWLNGSHLWNWSQICGNYILLFIKIFRNISTGFTPRPPLFILCQKWRPLKPQNLMKLYFLITPCSYICRIVFSRNVTPTFYPNIFSNFWKPIFSPHFPLFINRFHPPQGYFGVWPTNNLGYVNLNRQCFYNQHDQTRQHNIIWSLGTVDFLLGTIFDLAVTKFVVLTSFLHNRTKPDAEYASIDASIQNLGAIMISK